MRRPLLALLLLALLAGCAAPAPPAVVPTGQIDGAVVDHLLRPFDGQPVYIIETGQRDDTSPRGGFTFRNVPVGTYTLLANRDMHRGAAATLEVEENRITRVILQLVSIPLPAPYFVSQAHTASAEMASAGSECEECSWTIPIEGAPQEFTLEARWRSEPLGHDELDFSVQDNLGHTLHSGPGRSDGDKPFTIRIAGSDLHENATELTVRVKFGPGVMTQPRFIMNEVATFYYGATRDALFGR